MLRRDVMAALAAVLLSLHAAAGPALADGGPKRVQVTGEIIDTWCRVSGIMGEALGTAHHQCAIWCAIGGIPVGLQGDDGQVYVLIRMEADEANAPSPTLVDMQTERIRVDGDLYERDGLRYLVVSRVLANEGIVNLTHKDLGIVPFGE
jgi:hypothetical protein